MAQEVARSICLSNWPIKAAEIFVQAPKMRKGEWYLDIATTTQKAYEQLAHAEPSFRSHAFELVSSCAPFPSHHILMRIDGIDVRNGLLAIVNSIKEEVHGCVRIIAYWARFRHRPDDDAPASDDLRAKSMCLVPATTTRSKPKSSQAFSTSRTSSGQSASACGTTEALLSAAPVTGASHATSSGTAKLSAATPSAAALARQPARKSWKSSPRLASLPSLLDEGCDTRSRINTKSPWRMLLYEHETAIRRLNRNAKTRLQILPLYAQAYMCGSRKTVLTSCVRLSVFFKSATLEYGRVALVQAISFGNIAWTRCAGSFLHRHVRHRKAHLCSEPADSWSEHRCYCHQQGRLETSLKRSTA